MQTKEVKQTKQHTALMGGLSRLRAVLVLCTVAVLTLAPAQNLVPNGSFEEYATCPDSNFFGQWNLVQGWTSPYTPSVDYFNRCAGGVVCSVPFNNLGYQEPAHGDAYIGLATYVEGAPFYRETFGCQLSEPLQPGIPVYVSYKISPGGFGSWDGASAQYAAKGPGINFFTSYPADWSTYFFPNAAMVDMPGVLNDTSQWTTITGSFLPDSAYAYIVIGNFYSDSLSQVELFDTVFGAWFSAYAFVDQVCVSYDPGYCASWNGIQGTTGDRLIAQLDGDLVLLSMNNATTEPIDMRLLDAGGKLLWQGRWSVGQQTMQLHLGTFSNGLFTLVCSGQHTLLAPLKLVHVSP